MNFHNTTRFTEIESLLTAVSGSQARTVLKSHYGSNLELIHERAPKIAHLLSVFQQRFPSEHRIMAARIPGRINLMGVHIDHRGGWCNFMPIARETFFCFSPREDDRIVAHNVSSEYPDCDFSLNAEIPRSLRGRWMDFIESRTLERGHWENYLKAGALKLQDKLPDQALRGMNLIVDGDIPPRSGLSSSSTLVTGMVMALCCVNQIDIPEFELVELCGEGEWYVGTRGGCGDHAAMTLGGIQQIMHTGFKPLSTSFFPILSGYDILIAQSGIQANKATRARETFNSRIAAYEVALVLFRDAHPSYRERLVYLRDISPEQLDMPLTDFYQALKTIPLTARHDDLQRLYPHLGEEWERIFSTYGEPLEPLSLREVLLFGIAECDRARKFPRLFGGEDIAQAGRFMYISHDGDRIATWKNERSRPYRSPSDDSFLDRLSARALRDPHDPTLSPAWQPGGYRCSLPELDRLVDRCKCLEGVLGAGLTGAGLGGAILVLTRTENSHQVIDELKQLIALWYNGEPWVERCRSTAGASFL